MTRDPSSSSVVAQSPGSVVTVSKLPRLLADAGPAAAYAWDEFLLGQLRNPHTRAASTLAIRQFLAWIEPQGVPLERITPGMIGTFFDQHRGSLATKKLHLSAIRRLFDVLVLRHIIVLNPAHSVRGERYQVIEGKTPALTVEQAATLLASISTANTDGDGRTATDADGKAIPCLLGLRDRAVIGMLIFTAARAGAVARLRMRDLAYDGSQWSLRFAEKGGKSREIPVQHKLQQFLLDYLDAAGLREAPRDMPLFRTAFRKTGRLTGNGISGVDICRLVKRRIQHAGLPQRISPHSFRVTTVTDLLTQGVPLEDVALLAGHADTRTTRLYDRRQRNVTRNIVERISV
jgi:integrase/recombinase XerD